MDWIFPGFLISSLIHMFEEYVYPGGFTAFMKRLNPQISPFVSLPAVIGINGLQLLACVAAIAVGRDNLAFSMSVAGLLLINGLMHFGGSIRSKAYVPGVISGMFLYVPLAGYAYFYFLDSGELTFKSLIVSIALGLLYQTLPLGYFMIARVLKKGTQEDRQ